MNTKEILWHTKYKAYWHLTGGGLMVLAVILGVCVSPYFTWLILLGVGYIAYSSKDDD